MSKHPLIRMFDLLKDNTELVDRLNSIRGSNTEQPMIFTISVPETYQKTELAPFIRISEILLNDAYHSDNDSDHYRFLFAIETFSESINDVFQINEFIKDEILKPINGRVIARHLSEDKSFQLHSEMLEVTIFLKKKENLNG